MSEKTAKKLRKALFNVNVDIEANKYFWDSDRQCVVANEGRRIYQRAKKKAREIRKRGKLPNYDQTS
jgi:hypothetical protein